jgi:hypothetical protein
MFLLYVRKNFFQPLFVYVRKIFGLCPKKSGDGGGGNFNQEKKFSPPQIKYVPPPLTSSCVASLTIYSRYANIFVFNVCENNQFLKK